MAFSIASALNRHSSYSSSGTLSITIPARSYGDRSGFQKSRMNEYKQVRVPVEPDIAKRRPVNASALPLDFPNDLAGTDFWRA